MPAGQYQGRRGPGQDHGPPPDHAVLRVEPNAAIVCCGHHDRIRQSTQLASVFRRCWRWPPDKPSRYSRAGALADDADGCVMRAGVRVTVVVAAGSILAGAAVAWS